MSAGGWGRSAIETWPLSSLPRPVHAGGRGLSAGSRGVIRTPFPACALQMGVCALLPGPAPPRSSERLS